MRINNIIKGFLIKRYKRFLIDCQLENGEVVTAHCPNSGSMKSLLEEGNEVFLTYSNDPARKLKYQVQVIGFNNGHYALVNTFLPNKIVYDAINERKISELDSFKGIRQEVKYGEENSRIDILLEYRNSLTFVEVKNVTLMEKEYPYIAQFPDAITTRGSKHLRELIKEKEKNNEAVMFYIVNRTDCEKFEIASHIDKKYYETLKKAIDAGVKVLVYKSIIEIEENYIDINVDKKLILDI